MSGAMVFSRPAFCLCLFSCRTGFKGVGAHRWLLLHSSVFLFYRLKHIVILDIFIVAAGFMMRVVAGAEVIGVTISNWIVLCTMFLSLFLAVAKRRGESVLAEKEAAM